MPVLLYDFESGPLTVARGRTGKQGANCVNRLAIAPNDATDIALSKLQFEDRCFSAGDFREHHLVGIFDQVSNDKLQKFFHSASGVGGAVSEGVTAVGLGSDEAGVAAVTPCFLFFLSKLRTVSDGWAPRAIQYSARSAFNVLL